MSSTTDADDRALTRALLVMIVVLCAPSFLWHGLSAVAYYSGAQSLYPFAFLCAVASPFAFAVGVVLGLATLFRPAATTKVRIVIAAMLLVTFWMQTFIVSKVLRWS